MAPVYVGSIDQGTTSSRFLVFDTTGAVVASHQVEYEQIFPETGWHEQNPDRLLESVELSIERAVENMRGHGLDPAGIKAIGITNQRETTVCWDSETGKALCNAIVWDDTRTKDIVAQLADKHPSKSRDGTRPLCGLPLTTYFSAVKLRWMLDNVPAVKAADEKGTLRFGTVDSWLIYKLTGGKVHATDVTNASRTMLMDINTLQWSDEALEFFGFGRHVLPKICSSSEVYGDITAGPLAGIPIAGCLGDQQAATVGQRCFAPGEAKNTYGTGCFMIFNTGDKVVQSENGLLTTVAYKLGPDAPVAYGLEGSVAVAGSAVQWLRDDLQLVKSAPEIDVLASSVPDNAGVYFVTAFSGLFAPYWRDDARGCIVGLTRYAKRGHIARATLESVCYQTRAILEAMDRDSGDALRTLNVDGGLTNSDLCMQIQADILQISVSRPGMRETTAMGAAMAAGLATGVWSSVEELRGVGVAESKLFSPQITKEKADEMYAKWNAAVERSYNWA
ncbi:glycerol kinase [Ramicandelaber brevisporus]|nr:glycerol kinase [Ramicandelaber brevisporus]